MAIPYGENQFIYGLHDPGGERLLLENGQARGWVLVTEALGADPNNRSGKGDFYKRLAGQGLGVIVRLNHAYGPEGTIPRQAKYRDFARRVANFVQNSPGAHIWIIGNEMNLEREQPRLPGSNQAERIIPSRYADCYRLCRQAIKELAGHENDQVVVGAIGPWNGETPYEDNIDGVVVVNRLAGAPDSYPYYGFYGDFIVYLRDMLLAIGRQNCDAIAIHAYSHGYNPKLIFSNEKMGSPFQNYHYHFRTYRDQMNAIPAAFRDLPVYLTEANGDQEPNGARWPDVNSGWVKNAYQEINDWNQTPGNQQIRCMLLYRWSRDDAWHIDGKLKVQQDFKEAIARGYQWQPTSLLQTEGGPPMAMVTPSQAAYRTQFLQHNTPTSVSAGHTLIVNVTLQNAGSQTWVTQGAQPFRLGFQWYDSASQMVQFPSELNFRTALPQDVPPGGRVSLAAQLRTPDKPGAYYLRWDMLHEGVTWFTSQGDQGLVVGPVTVTAAPAVVQPQPTPATIQIQDMSGTLPRSSTVSYPLRSRTEIRRVILHHTATAANVSVERIAQFQVNNRNLPGITYHFCVTGQGQVYQTQPLEVASQHAGATHSEDSVGIGLIGNFTETAPPQPQLDATAVLLASLLKELGLTVNQIFAFSELAVTGSPGATWPQWRDRLLSLVSNLIARGVSVRIPAAAPAGIPTPTPGQPGPTPAPVADKPLQHYLLFWYRGRTNWAEWDVLGAMDYIAVFAPTIGFSVETAKLAKFVTIVGGTGGVPASAEQELRAAGCQVGRVDGGDEAGTRRRLQELAAQGKRF